MKWTFKIICLLLLFSRPALAHLLHFSSSDLKVDLPKVEWTIEAHTMDFASRFGAQSDSEVQETLDRHLRVSLDQRNCILQQTKVVVDAERDLVILPLVFMCPAKGENLQVAYGLFFGDSSHQHLLKFHQRNKIIPFTFTPSKMEATFSATTSIWSSVSDFFGLGFNHILFGFDHILFILSLILGAVRFRSLLLLVTAFTVAHSLTLGLAVFDIVNLSSRFVEPMIAGSIICVALRHLITGESKKIKWDLGVTFLFGLIHGLGFSTALKEVQIPANQMLVPLLSFNLGVEGCQILIVGLVYPFIVLLRKRSLPIYHLFIRASLILITGIALYWLFQRIR